MTVFMILLLIDQLVKGFQIENFRHKLLIRQPLADIQPLLEYRDGGIELGRLLNFDTEVLHN